MRRLKKQRIIAQEAISKGIVSVGGLAKAVLNTSPLDKKARAQAAKIRYSVTKRTDS